MNDTPSPAAGPAPRPAAVDFDINRLDRAFLEDPFPTYRRLREQSPLHRNADGTVMVTRYADVVAVLRDRRMSNDKARDFARKLRGDSAIFEHHIHTMVFRDPPDHTRLRRLVSHAFTPKALAAHEPLIERAVDALLTEKMAGGSMDLIADFTYLLPLSVIAALMGVPTDETAQFRRWSSAVTASLEPTTPPAVIDAGNAAVAEFKDYFDRLAQERRRRPGSDILSLLVQAEDEGDRLTGLDLVHNAAFLLNAGHETTSNLVGNGINALFDNPAQMALLRQHPELAESAVEEMLRYDSPLQIGGRLPTETVTFQDTAIPAGTFIWISNGAANRDDAVFPDADRFDIARDNSARHVAFGHGIHLCLGASLARLEAKIAVRALVTRYPALRRNGEPVRRLRARHRGFDHYPVAA